MSLKVKVCLLGLLGAIWFVVNRFFVPDAYHLYSLVGMFVILTVGFSVLVTSASLERASFFDYVSGVWNLLAGVWIGLGTNNPQIAKYWDDRHDWERTFDCDRHS